MSTTLRDVLEGGDYDLTVLSDAEWFLSRRNEIEELIELAEQTVEEAQEGVDDEDEI